MFLHVYTVHAGDLLLRPELRCLWFELCLVNLDVPGRFHCPAQMPILTFECPEKTVWQIEENCTARNINILRGIAPVAVASL